MILALIATAALALCIYGALNDVACLKIPNWLNGTLAALGLVALLGSGLALSTMGWHLLIAVVALVISMGLFFAGVFGGGDAKMIPAVALWMGPVAVMPFLMGMAFVGGALALIGLVSRYAPLPMGTPAWILNTLSKGDGVPYGVAIAAGAIFAAPLSPLFAPALSATSFAG